MGRNHLLLAASALLVLATVWLLPVEITPGRAYRGKLYAAASWQVAVSGQGHLQSLLSERASGVVSRYAMQTVERGEASDFLLATGIEAGATVQAGDTVGTLRETGLDQRRVARVSDVTVATREQAAAESGEKEALITEARARLERTEALMALQERIVARTRQLHARALVSDEELDTAQSELTTLSGDASVIRAQLDVLQTGARPADVSLARARVDAARQQLEALDRRGARTAIVSPISGVVTRSVSDSVLVQVTDTSAWIVLVPLPLVDRNMLAAGRPVSVLGTDWSAAGTVTAVDTRVQKVGAVSVVLVIVALNEAPAAALEGLPVQIRVDQTPVRLRTYLVGKLQEWFPVQDWLSHAPRV